VVRQSEVLSHRKKWLFCKVTPVSIQAFVEGLIRLANVFEATDGTLKNVTNICLIIEQNCLLSDFQRENREIFWIKELRVLHPDGINRKQ
jgi:hypothetical protein